jgi:hypothetical protein
MVDINQAFDHHTADHYNEDALRESLLIAELAHNDVIPRAKLPELHIYLDGERAQLVGEALETLDAMSYTVEREDK